MNPALLPTVLLHGLVAGGFALLFRALPWPKSVTSPADAPPESGRSGAFAVWFSRKFWGCKACAAGRPAALLAMLDPAVTGADAWVVFFGALGLGAFLYAHAGPMDLGGD